MPETPDEAYQFRGFRRPHYTQAPDELFDELLAPGRLTEAELRCLLYIVRRTFGFKKDEDKISLSQFSEGIVTREGKRLDYGAGVGRAAAMRAVRSLARKGIVVMEHSRSAEGDFDTTSYRLRMEDDPSTGWDRKESTVASQRSYPGIAATLPVDSSRVPQETVQETENKRDSDASSTEEAPPPYSPYLAQVVLDHARELGAAPRGPAAVGEVLRLWVASGLSETAFADRLHAARTTARKGQGRGVDKWSLYLKALRDEPPAARR